MHHSSGSHTHTHTNPSIFIMTDHTTVGDNTGNSSVLAYCQLVYAKQLLLTDWLTKTRPKYVKTASSQPAKVKTATHARSTATEHRGAFGDDCEMKRETASQGYEENTKKASLIPVKTAFASNMYLKKKQLRTENTWTHPQESNEGFFPL